MPNLDENQIKILKAFAEIAEPTGTKNIIAATDLSTSMVTNKIKALKTAGLIDSPVRCKYCLTDQGKAELK